MSRSNTYHIRAVIPSCLEQKLRSQVIASEPDTLHTLILRHLKLLSSYLENPVLSKFVTQLRPSISELYRFNKTDSLTEVWVITSGNVASFTEYWLDWFHDNYFYECDRSQSDSLRTHFMLFILLWSSRIPTHYLGSAEGKLRWMLDDCSLCFGRRYRYTALRSKLRELQLHTEAIDQTLQELTEKGYLCPTYRTSRKSVQILLPFNTSKIGGEIAASRDRRSDGLSIQRHLITGMAGNKEAPPQFFEIMAGLKNENIYLVRYYGTIAAILSDRIPAGATGSAAVPPTVDNGNQRYNWQQISGKSGQPVGPVGADNCDNLSHKAVKPFGVSMLEICSSSQPTAGDATVITSNGGQELTSSSPIFRMHLELYNRHEIQDRIAFALHNLSEGIWGRIDITFPTVSARARAASPNMLHLWHPAHYAIVANPRLQHWAFLVEDKHVYYRKYAHLLKLVNH